MDLTILSEDERISNYYGSCTISLFEYLFSTLGVRLFFTAFEVGVFNYLMVDPSQINLSGWAYVKPYKYYCEYLKEKPFVFLFFHLFFCSRGTSTRPREWGLVLLVSTIRIFEDFSGLPVFAY